jgi:hypothetical protein
MPAMLKTRSVWWSVWTPGQTHFYGPNGRDYYRTEYSRSDARTLCDYLNSR